MEFQENPVAEKMTATHDVGSQLFALAAIEADNADIRWINHRLGVISTADRHVMIDGSVGNESVVGAKSVKNKSFAKQLFDEAGLTTAGGELTASEDDAVRIARELSFPVVVKPASGGLGKGVSVDLMAEDEVRTAYTDARAFGESIVVEKHINIEDEFRCIATPDSFISAFKRVLPFVVGDGKSTIHELVMTKNEARKSNPILRASPIPLDDALKRTIERQGYREDSVLPTGQRLVVRNVNGLTSGGEPHEYSDAVDVGIKDAACRAVAAVPGTEWAGVDLAVERGTGKPFIIEVNAAASYGGSAFPLEGPPRDVAGELWRLRKERGEPLDPSDPPAPARRPVPVELADTLPRRRADDGRLLSAIVTDLIVDQGHRIDYPAPGLIRLRGKEGDDRWLTTDLGSVHDLLAARRAVRKHSTVRRLLAFQDIRRPFGRPAQRITQLDRVYEDYAGLVAVTAAGKAWGSAGCHVVDRPGAEQLIKGGGIWHVQRYRTGTRVRVVASQHEAFFITTSAEPASLNDSELQRVSRLAVWAVRAIPELCWGSVDIYLGESRAPTDRQDGGMAESVADADAPRHAGTRRPRVEGIQVNPRFSRDEVLIAGDIPRFVDWILRD